MDAALRVVLNVRETKRVEELNEENAKLRRELSLVRAAFFQKTIRVFSSTFLAKVNSMNENTQRLVCIYLDRGLYNLLFVEPTLGMESYLVIDELGDTPVYMNDVEVLANVFQDLPWVYDEVMKTLPLLPEDQQKYECDAPAEGIVCL